MAAECGTAAFVSSNAYYGYIPPKTPNNLCQRVQDAAVHRNAEKTAIRNVMHVSEMETDDDADQAPMLNYDRCVIPENRAEAFQPHNIRQPDAGMFFFGGQQPQRRSRKRQNSDSFLEPAFHLKKLREETLGSTHRLQSVH